MLKRTLDLVPLVATAALAASLVDRLLTSDPSGQEPISHSSPFLPGLTENGHEPVEGDGKMQSRSISLATSGLTQSRPNDRYARELGAIALRQLQGRYWIGANGHLYVNAANHQQRALLLRSFPGSAGLPESWSWLAEMANFDGPEVWSSSREISPAERRQGVEWRGGFLLVRRVLDPVTFQPRTAFRLFSYSDRSWDRWRDGIVAVSADASRKNGRWTIQWRLDANGGRFLLGNDPGVHPEHAALFGEPFFLLPIGASDIP